MNDRPAVEGDLPAIDAVYRTALADLYARTGVTTALPSAEFLRMVYGHIVRTGIFRVVEDRGRIVAIAGAVVREDLWFLSAFWALPELQRKGVGAPLLRSVWDAGARAGARTFFTWSSTDPTAVAVYMKAGMLPGWPVFTLEGEPRVLPGAPAGWTTAPLEPEAAASFDRDVRGAPRGVDHAFFSQTLRIAGRQVLHLGRLAGYYYVGRGAIAPVAWATPDDARPVLALAARDAAAVSPVLRTYGLGPNHEALRFALEAGLRVSGHAHVLMTAPFGHPDRYVPWGPSLF